MSQSNSNHRYTSGRDRVAARTYDAARYRFDEVASQDTASHAVRPRPASPEKRATPPTTKPVATVSEAADQPNKQPNKSAEKLPIINSEQPLIQDAFPPKNKNNSAKQQPQKSQVLHRQAVQKPFEPPELAHLTSQKTSRKAVSSLVYLRKAFIATAVIAMVSGLGVLAAFAVNNSEGKDAEEVLSQSVDRASSTQTEQQATVDETPVSKDDIHSNAVPDDYPKSVRIDTIDIEARIKAAGVNRHQQLIMPDNIFDVNWYEGSRLPGQNGTVLLSGYVSGPTERGIFYYTRALEHGDIITLKTGDGTSYTYEVKHRELKSYDDIDLIDLLVPYETGSNWLHMVAVDDRYNIMSEGFQDRLIIYAQQQ